MPVISKSRVNVEDKVAKLRRLTYAWHTPPFMQDGDADFDILADALGADGTGRLYQSLVHKNQLAQEVAVFQLSQQYSSLFVIQVTLRSGADLGAAERIVTEEMAKVRKQPISQREFNRAVTSVESSFVWRLENLLARAELLQRYNHYMGTPDYIRQDLERYTRSSPDRVQKLASQYLQPERRLDILTLPATQEGK
jgi:zinc protease